MLYIEAATVFFCSLGGSLIGALIVRKFGPPVVEYGKNYE